MNVQPDFFLHDPFAADEPTIFDAELRLVRARFLGEPAHELDADAAHFPQVVFAIADLHVRPAPEQAVVMVVVGRKVVGQRLAIEPIDRMNVAGANARFANAGKASSRQSCTPAQADRLPTGQATCCRSALN